MFMANLSIRKKFGILIIGSAFIVFLALFLYLMHITSNSEKAVLQKTSDRLISQLKEKLKAKDKVGLTSALAIANDPTIIDALMTGNREEAIPVLQNMQKAMNEEPSEKTITIHVHTAELKSFIRSWRPDKYGDDLSGFRYSLHEVKNTKKPIAVFEIGVAGLSHRSVAPVINKGEYIGSLEIIQTIDDIFTDFSSNNQIILVLMDQQYINTAEEIKDNPRAGNYVVAQKDYDKAFVDTIKNIDIQALEKNKYSNINGYFVTALPVKGANNADYGYFLLAEKTSAVMGEVNDANKIIWVFLIGAAVLVVVILVCVMLIFNSLVMRRIMKLSQLFAASGSGDLTARMECLNNDEMGILCRVYDKFLDQISNMLADIKISVAGVASGNGELASTTQQFSATFRQQTSEISSIAAAMEEMSASSIQIGNTIGEGIEVSKAVSEKVNTGNKHLHKSIEKIEGIRNETKELSGSISNLTESSLKIGSIIKVINDIAEQTNLLALNAAIEAARAGDAGKGFAVVADEVKKLAGRTQSSTKEISDIINALRHETENASKYMDAAEKSVDDGIDTIQEILTLFNGIVTAVTDMHRSMDAIQVTVNEQNNAITNTNTNIQSISAGVEESSSTIEEVGRTVNDLHRLTEELNILVERFKLS